MLKLVIFDFDGVIAESFEMCFGLNQLLDPKITREEYRTKFEKNINKARAKSGAMTMEDFFTRYEEKVPELKVVPGMPDVLEKVSQRYQTAICSSTIGHPIDLFLYQHHLRQYFNAVFGNEVDPSKVVKFRLLFEQFKVSADESLFITDTAGDIHEATEVGLKTLAVTWGYHDRSRLEKGHPLAILDQPEQIVQFIGQNFG